MEFGVIYPKGIAANNKIPRNSWMTQKMASWIALDSFRRPNEYPLELNTEIKSVDGQIKTWHRESPATERLERIPGIGPLTASAIAGE